MFKVILFFCLVLILLPGIIYNIYSQENIKQVRAIRISSPPKIDGKLNEEVWKTAPVAKDFIQFVPYNGSPAWQKSEVKILYDNTALYIGAMLYDTAPDSILKGLSERDNINNADYMGMYIDPQGTGLNGFGFFVTASGVQVDMKVDHYNEDGSWDAVWKSEVSIVDSGWIAEIKIPFTALRFPKTDVQKWKVNFWRNIMRHRQNTTWSFVNRNKDGILNQSGELLGLENIKPPLRLSFMPYLSSYLQKNPDNKKWNSVINGGMDLKYGINESFTLDLTMIPDFGQVQSDDKILNLTPFETYYSERRPFFTEGTELFNKLGIFYSRRIGGVPLKHDTVENNLKNGEVIISNPIETRMINATKISGRTKGGLGIGLFNAMTGNTYAVIADSLGKRRSILTQPFTNYNMIVLDQDLKNNSALNFSNTNVLRVKDGYMADVAGGELVLKNKTKTYGIITRGGISQKYRDTSKAEFGNGYYLRAGKLAGKFQGYLGYTSFSDKFDCNDMGYLQKNNYTETELFLRYEEIKPFWIIEDWFNYIDAYHWDMFNPSVFTANGIYLNSTISFKNKYMSALNMSLFPNGDKDYYEPRVTGKYVIPFNKQYHIGGWINTDSRKKLSFFFNPGTRWWDDKGHYEQWFNESVYYRLNDKLSFEYDLNFDNIFKQRGWVKTNANSIDTIYFGKRQVKSISNIFIVKYIFSNSSYFSFRLRHDNQVVTYEKQYYELNNDGTLRKSNYFDNNNMDYNVFNIDMTYTWRFAPGSDLSIVWKNMIENDVNIITGSYFNNLDNTIKSPQSNSFSFKIIYYLDYLYLKKG